MIGPGQLSGNCKKNCLCLLVCIQSMTLALWEHGSCVWTQLTSGKFNSYPHLCSRGSWQQYVFREEVLSDALDVCHNLLKERFVAHFAEVIRHADTWQEVEAALFALRWAWEWVQGVSDLCHSLLDNTSLHGAATLPNGSFCLAHWQWGHDSHTSTCVHAGRDYPMLHCTLRTSICHCLQIGVHSVCRWYHEAGVDDPVLTQLYTILFSAEFLAKLGHAYCLDTLLQLIATHSAWIAQSSQVCIQRPCRGISNNFKGSASDPVPLWMCSQPLLGSSIAFSRNENKVPYLSLWILCVLWISYNARQANQLNITKMISRLR